MRTVTFTVEILIFTFYVYAYNKLLFQENNEIKIKDVNYSWPTEHTYNIT